MAKTNKSSDQIEMMNHINDVKRLDSTLTQILRDSSQSLNGSNRDSELNSVINQYNELINQDSYNFTKNKTISQSSYSYMANMLVGKPLSDTERKNPKKIAENDALNRAKMEQLFSNGDMQVAGYFLSQSSDIHHIYDEIESVCAYMYQLDLAIELLRDNILNSEQSLTDLPFDISFNGIDPAKSAEYVKTAIEAVKEVGLKVKLHDHIVPKTLKFGKYYVMTIPYSEIGVKMLDPARTGTKTAFNSLGSFTTESTDGETIQIDPDLSTCMESVEHILDSMSTNDESNELDSYGGKDSIMESIKFNLERLTISEEATPPNVTGISEASYDRMPDDLKKEVEKALKNNEKLFNATIDINKPKTKNGSKYSEATVDTTEGLEDIPGCYVKLIDPRQLSPIKIFDHTLGYYYLENYDYARRGTSITDLLSNTVNFNDQNLFVDNLVGTLLKKLKYGELMTADNDFKSLILNCVLYAERRNEPIRIKFIPCDYITEFNVNCDENGNGQPILMKSIIFARMYMSLLLFTLMTIFTKSTDTEFYYLKENAITPSYQEQVADIIEQFRNSNVDMSSILNGNVMHGNRAINKRYFMPIGTSDNKPFDVEVISGQNVDIHSDLLNDLKKMAIGSTGVPDVAIDYMNEIEFATILKMTNTRTLSKANSHQTDINGDTTCGITGLVRKIVKFNKPGLIPDDALSKCECKLRINNTINNNTSGDEINNVIATVDNMLDAYYKGQSTENPEIIEYRKEEMRKRLIMLMTSSLPWGELQRMDSEVKIDAEKQRLENEMLKNKQETSDQA